MWRRAAAALVDMGLALILLQGIAAVGFQLTGGRVTTGIDFSTVCTSAPTASAGLDLPRGASLPEGFVPDQVSLCRSSFLGATTGLAYVLSRTEAHVGLDVTTSHAVPVDTGWRAAGGLVDLDPFLLPLFVLLRWAFDRCAGATPGRWLARIRVAEAESTGARIGAALGADLTRRYSLFARPYLPILAVGSAQALYGVATGGATLVLAAAAAVALAVALASQVVAAAAIAQGRSTFYDRPCATLVADLTDLAPVGAVRPAAEAPPWKLPAPKAVYASGAFVALLAAVTLAVGLSRSPRTPVVRSPPAVARVVAPARVAEQHAPPEADAAPGGTAQLYGSDIVALRLAQAAELAAQAEAAAERGQPSFATDLAHAIAIEQGVTDTDASRAFAFEAESIVGRNLFLGGDMLGSISENTRALGLRNGDVRVLKQRSVAEFYMAEQSDALADLDAAVVNAPGDAEAALWREIVAHRLGQTSRIEADARAVDTTRWPAPIVDLFRGRSSPDALLARVLDFDLSRWAQHRCEAEFFIGEWHVIRGEHDAARDALRVALKACPDDAMEAHAAEDELLGRAGFK